MLGAKKEFWENVEKVKPSTIKDNDNKMDDKTNKLQVRDEDKRKYAKPFFKEENNEDIIEDRLKMLGVKKEKRDEKSTILSSSIEARKAYSEKSIYPSPIDEVSGNEIIDDEDDINYKIQQQQNTLFDSTSLQSPSFSSDLFVWWDYRYQFK